MPIVLRAPASARASPMLARATRRAVDVAARACARSVPTRASGASARAMASRARETHLCVLAGETLVGSGPLARLSRELPRAFARCTIGSDARDFESVLSASDEDLVILWWFAPRALTEAFAGTRAAAARTRWTHSGSAGVEHLLAIPAVREHASVMTNARGAFSASLGEWGVFACLHFAKRVDVMRAAQREGRWIRQTVGMIQGKRMCVVGYGDIGQHVARRAKAMGMRVSAVRRSPEKTSPHDDAVERVTSFKALKEAVSDADYVVVALPSTDETYKMIDAGVFEAMKETSILINVGRGSTVDEDALLNALKTKKIAGAALDVFAVEPLPSDHEFYKMENVLISFHCADLTEDYHDLAMDCFFRHAEQYAAGEPFTNVVDKTLGY